MAALSAELSALQAERQSARRGEEQHTRVSDERWARWWPEAESADEPFTVLAREDAGTSSGRDPWQRNQTLAGSRAGSRAGGGRHARPHDRGTHHQGFGARGLEGRGLEGRGAERRGAEGWGLSEAGSDEASARSFDEGGPDDRGLAPGRSLLSGLRGGLAQIAPVHVAVGGVVVAVALGLSAWWVVNSQPQEVAASPAGGQPSAPVSQLVAGGQNASPRPTGGTVAGATSASAGPLGTGVPSANSESAIVVVHVAGKVRHPGIQALPLGSRVVDAVRAAGGPRPGVSLSSLNLARLVSDGEQILIGVPGGSGVVAGPAPSGGSGPSPHLGDTAGLVNINTADATALEALPAVGPVTAAAIVAYRQEHGPFGAVDQLLDVSGIGEATLAQIAPHATL